MPDLAIISLGCSKNLVDTEHVLGELFTARFTLTPDPAKAEYLIINTCGFLKSARQETLSYVKDYPHQKIILIGCYTHFLSSNFFLKYPQIAGIISAKYYPQIARLITRIIKGKKIFKVEPAEKKYLEMPQRILSSPKTSYAYVKIADGCNNQCSYCLIPQIKGRYRSRQPKDILKEIKDLQQVPEIILLAQDTSGYGSDLNPQQSLAKLLKKIIKLNPSSQIRILYTYPEKITPELIEVIAKNKPIIKYLDIPWQHASPQILKQMRRSFDIAKTKELIKSLRQKIPGICLRTTFIVGFPGETEQDFQVLKEFVAEMRFDRVGVFEYSREKGTFAYHLPNQVSGEIKRQRREELMWLQQKISRQINKNFIGQKLEVLVEDYDPERKLYFGRSYRDCPEVDGGVFFSASEKITIGKKVLVDITKADDYDLRGKA
jgi:ribosomal protein S12 methylthiotransferase